LAEKPKIAKTGRKPRAQARFRENERDLATTGSIS